MIVLPVIYEGTSEANTNSAPSRSSGVPTRALWDRFDQILAFRACQKVAIHIGNNVTGRDSVDANIMACLFQ